MNAEYRKLRSRSPRAVEAVRNAYYRIGYRQVSIVPAESDTSEGVALALNIDEGKATRIAEVLFTGQLGLSHEQLVASLQLQAGDVLNLSELDDGLRSVRERYRSAGYLRAKVSEPQIEALGSGRARIRIPVESGPPIHFLVRGNFNFASPLLLSKLQR